MFDTATRRDVLATSTVHGLDARALVEASVRDLLDTHPEIRAVRWVQRIDGPDPEVFLVSKVAVEFTSGATFDLDTATGDSLLDATAHALIADLVLAQSYLLVAAFGVGVSVVASRAGIEVTPLRS